MVELILQHMIDDNNPILRFSQWMEEAKLKEPIPEACSLATCDELGTPHVRIVLIRRIDQELEEMTFFTNLNSSKVEQLMANPRVALCFYWKSIRKQVRARGTARLASENISRKYFTTRPRASQITSWASNQSKVIKEGTNLKQVVEVFRKKFEGKDIPKPQDWGGVTVALDEMELWQEKQGRQHLRVQFTKDSGKWNSKRLYP